MQQIPLIALISFSLILFVTCFKQVSYKYFYSSFHKEYHDVGHRYFMIPIFLLLFTYMALIDSLILSLEHIPFTLVLLFIACILLLVRNIYI